MVLAVAVSGGPDSLALLWLAATAFPGQVRALSVDHGLRPESAAECRMVAACAAQKGVAHATLRLDPPPGPASIQADARTRRYRAMAGWCQSAGIAHLLTAHHADDQAETLLMRLARGSGLPGLCGIRARTEMAGVTLLRPVLDWSRSTLRAVLAQTDWQPVEDPANTDPRHDRARIRALLAQTPALLPRRLAASAAHLAEAEDALTWAAGLAFASRAQADGNGFTLDPEALPPELRRRLLRHCLERLGLPAPDGPALARLQAALESGGTGTLGGIRAKARPDGRWQLGPAPARRKV